MAKMYEKDKDASNTTSHNRYLPQDETVGLV